MTKTLRVIGSFFSLLLLSTPSLADLEYSYASAGEGYAFATLTLKISGTVNPTDFADAMKLDRLAKAKVLADKGPGAKLVYWADLDSSGGRISTALALGRYLRARDAHAMVKRDAVCMSSCVYILAGAPFRSVKGKVGIHRPYDPTDGDVAVAKQKEKYAQLGTEVAAYLKEMNIPARLYEDSMYISPERVKILSAAELQSYGLSVNEPYSEEANEVSRAKGMGVTRVELAQREARAASLCPEGSTPATVLAWVDCRNAILKGDR